MDNECELNTDVNIKLEFTDPCKDIMFNMSLIRGACYAFGLPTSQVLLPFRGKFLG